MNQDKILKIIKGLNTFSPDDIVMMSDIDETKAKNIINTLVLENKIIPVSGNKYRYLNQSKNNRNYLRLIEKPDIKNIKENKNITFKQAAEYFLTNHALINCTPSSYKTYISILKTNLLPFFGNKKLFSITKQDIQKFIEIKQSEGMTNKRLSNCVTLLGNIFRKFKEWELIQDSPYNGIINVKYSRKQKIQILMESQVEILLKTAKVKYPDLYPLILLILSTGIKKAEIMALKKEDIDIESRKININKTLCEGELLIPKVKTAIRQVYVTENIIPELKKAMKNKKENDFIFYDISLSHFTTGKHIRKNLSDLLKELNLPKITFNELRHTYAYNSLQAGMSIDCLHKQLGDYLIQATIDRYRDFIPVKVSFHAR